MKRKFRFFRGLSFNLLASVTLALLVMALIVSFIVSSVLEVVLSDAYNQNAESASELCAEHFDADTMYSFIEQKRNDRSSHPEESKTYKEYRDWLQMVCDTHKLTFIYIIESGKYKDLETPHGQYDVIMEVVAQNYYFEPWTLGEHHTAKPEYAVLYKEVFESGKTKFLPRPDSTSATGGPHTTAIYPLVNDKGEMKALICTQIEMDFLEDGINKYIKMAVPAVLTFTSAVIIFVAILLKRRFISPVVMVTNEAKRFAEENSQSENRLSSSIVTKLNEIRDLAEVIDDMEEEILDYVGRNTSMAAENERIGTELNVARVIQKSAIPSIFPPFPDRNEFDIYASMTPAKEVGGDFYDFFFIDSDHLALVMADVSGKGIPASLYMMISKVLLSDRALLGGEPNEILSFVNSRICEKNDAEMFVTIWIGILELSSGRLVSSNAGHEDPLIYRKGEDFSYRKESHGLVAGAINGIHYTNNEYKLEPGDKLFLYTDGATEATNSRNELFGKERLLESVNASGSASTKSIIEKVKEDIDEFVGEAPQFDDLTMLCFELKEQNEVEAVFDAKLEKLQDALDFVDTFLEKKDCPMKAKMQLDLSIEELFVNVANYAYPESEGKVSLRLSEEGGKVTMVMADEGIPFDPLKKPEPDVTLPAEERPIGGLGVFIVKKHMDSVFYKYEDGKNVLTMTKTIT